MATLLEASPTGDRWQMLWCHERCHKAEMRWVSEQMHQMVAALGGLLQCFKKAQQFENWLARSPKTDYVLLTDWREAKPCTDCLAERPCMLPSMLIVLCGSMRQVARAKQWQLNLQGIERERVHVVDLQGGFSKEWLGGMIAHCLDCQMFWSVGLRPPARGMGPSQSPEAARPWDQWHLPLCLVGEEDDAECALDGFGQFEDRSGSPRSVFVRACDEGVWQCHLQEFPEFGSDSQVVMYRLSF